MIQKRLFSNKELSELKLGNVCPACGEFILGTDDFMRAHRKCLANEALVEFDNGVISQIKSL